MIPIRNFPYTDYHDLNLDWLLRQLQIWEVDLDELKRRVKVLEDWRTDTVDPDLHDIKLDIIDIKGDIIDLGNKIKLVNNWMRDLIKEVRINPANNNPYDIVYINGAGHASFPNLIKALFGSGAVSPIGADSSYGSCICAMYESNHIRLATYELDSTNNILTFKADYGSYYKIISLTKTGDEQDQFTITKTTEAKIVNNVIHLDTIHTTEAQINAVIDTNDDPDTNTDYPYIWEYSDANITANCIVNAVFSNLKQNITYSDYFSDYIETSSGKITFYLTDQFPGNADPIDIDLYMVK